MYLNKKIERGLFDPLGHGTTVNSNHIVQLDQ